MGRRPDNQLSIAQSLSSLGDALWDKAQIHSILTAWVNSVGEKGEGRFEDALTRQGSCKEYPMLHFAPALILRKRSERSLIRVFDDIIKQIGGGDPVKLPAGIVKIISIGANDKSFPSDDAPHELAMAPTDDGEVYFPLSANEQQRKIIQLGSSSNGVIVQGPPGTGKSQTIVNLICHLLATGQRILVTSQTARALQTLRDKLPEEIRPLCISLLGNDQKALCELGDAVLGITNKYNQWDANGNQTLISQKLRELDENRSTLAELSRKLRIVREVETQNHESPVPRYRGKLSFIANQLREDEARYSWLKGLAVEKSIPLTNAEASEIWKISSALEHERAEEFRNIEFDLSETLEPTAFEDLVSQETTTLTQLEQIRSNLKSNTVESLEKMSSELRIDLYEHLKHLKAKIVTLNAPSIEQWVGSAVKDILGDRDRMWRDLYSQTRGLLNQIQDKYVKASNTRMTYKPEFELYSIRSDCEELLSHFKSGGKLRGLFGTPKAVKACAYFLEDIRINGKRLHSMESVQDFVEWFEVYDAFQLLSKLWDRLKSKEDDLPFSRGFAVYNDLCEPLRDLIELHETLCQIKSKFNQINDLLSPIWHDLESLSSFLSGLEAQALNDNLLLLRSQLRSLRARVLANRERNSPSLGLQELFSAIEARDSEAYRSSWNKVSGILKQKKKFDRFFSLLRKLEIGCPSLAKSFKEDLRNVVWEDRFSNFVDAWEWAIADAWFSQLSDPDFVASISKKYENCEQQQKKLIADLAANKSWRHFFSRLTEGHRQNLMAWTLSMKKIGKGKGKYRATHRAAAREHLEGCRSAIPAWIMPIYRIAESIDPQPEVFDVVIIDEASQSGPEALFLQYLAKKIIVVGDNKQISPESIGLHREEIDQLRKKFLNDIPHKDHIGADDSFFDLALIRFPSFIRLREHFRCMPEIIQFSNNLFYIGEPLQPLKQFTSDRLDPIQIRFVEKGYEKGERASINIPEGEAIVQQIVDCCKDPKYDGKTMGVISLKSTSAQAYEIEKYLLRDLGPEEIERRQIVCGDPYDFQGDERDIIFLSMVSAPGSRQRISALTAGRFERSFNVATSRAKDQMWLFHSIQLADLSKECLRYKLIQYCQNPRVEQGIFDHTQVFPDRRVPPFDSLFEQRVFLKIILRGYRVIPQYHVAGYYIDLVVEGINGRIAVECDGDECHGPEEYDRDIVRQRQLERCHWIFERVRESYFNRDPDEALKGIWKTLERHSIFPSKAASVAREFNDELQGTPQTSTTDEKVAGRKEDLLKSNGASLKLQTSVLDAGTGVFKNPTFI